MGSREVITSFSQRILGIVAQVCGPRVCAQAAHLKKYPSHALAALLGLAPMLATAQTVKPTQTIPPRVAQAQRFLASRAWPRNRPAAADATRPRADERRPLPAVISPAQSWQPLGPAQVQSQNDGLVTGRISSIAFDPEDTTGNHVYIGTTGGGLWVSQNAAASPVSGIVFTPMMDALSAMRLAQDASISIGAVSVQPGGTGVLLAGTGDPNDALDSYYGAGILRSADGGNTWNLIQTTSDQMYVFAGEGFAGFTWSTVNPQLVVAAVSQAYEGTLVQAERTRQSYEGLYYSLDSGATWSLATITDPNGSDVQGALDSFDGPNGNAATSVVWNPIRKLFIAAVRYHGYYSSPDGVTWTRLATQPGSGFSTTMCPSNPGTTGSVDCPIFRGILAVNPQTGDTFAWTVDASNQDGGIWQDACGLSGATCSNPTISFATRWNTTALETSTNLGAATIANGDYDLALAAIPSGQDTLLLAGANDLWKCSLAMGCQWRNTTNANSCMSAQVAGYQHTLAWNPANPSEILIGNDSGLWRSMDAIGEAQAACSPDDANHFQNLNGAIGSLAEIESMSAPTVSPYTLMAGLGANGTAGVKSATAPTPVWPEILSGEGGPSVVDPTNSANWYVNSQAGVSIHACTQSGACTPSDFGPAVVTDADVNGDGYTMTAPAPFLVDPLDPAQLLIGTCRIWRGLANGSGWTNANAISPFFDGVTGKRACNGDPLVRSIAALALPGGGEVIYVGMFGALDGGGIRAGHIFSARFDPVNGWSTWSDLTRNPVGNDNLGFNVYGLDVSSLFVDPHDPTGNTVYVTVEGMTTPTMAVRVAYRSTDGGAHWMSITSNLLPAPANSILVDPQDANTVYLALDLGVYATRNIASCSTLGSNCWSALGTGLPEAPVTQLAATPSTVTPSVLVAGTYGRGIWQIPLLSAGAQLSTATVDRSQLDFGTQAVGTVSSAQSVALTNTGGVALAISSIGTTADFSETDDCQSGVVNAGAACTVHVTFEPSASGDRAGQLTISANVAGGQLVVPLSGTGVVSGAISLNPLTLNFGTVATGAISAALPITAENDSSSSVSIASLNVAAPFALATDACGGAIAAHSDCQLTVTFAPVQAGAANGTLTLQTANGETQAVQLSGTGAAPPTDTLSPTSLSFPGTVIGAQSSPQTVTLTNSGGVPLTGIAISTSGPFQNSNNCTSQLSAGSNCAIAVIFAPAAQGPESGTLTVSDALRSQTVALSGTGLQPPAIGVSAMSLSFAAQTVGTASVPLTLTVTNTGGSPMANVGFQVTGQSSANFSVSTTTCGAVLGSGSNCTAQLIFTPSISGSNAALLTVSSSTTGVKPVTIALSGTGIAAAGLNVNPAQLSFTEAVIGQASAAQTVTISNTANTAATGLTLAISSSFSVTQNSCRASLAVGASCTVDVAFTPQANGAVAGTLIVDSTSLSAAEVKLTGIGGLAGVIQFQPASINFPDTGVGTTSDAQTVTLTNTSAVILTALTLTISPGFQMASNTCGTELAPGSSCTASLAFAPTSAGSQTGSLTVASAALPVSVQARLTGMGTDFSAAVSGSQSQSVASGQAARYTLVLSPASGSSGTFAFSCSALPENAVCSFSPNTETVAAGTTGTVIVDIATGSSSASAQHTKISTWDVVRYSAGFSCCRSLPVGGENIYWCCSQGVW